MSVLSAPNSCAFPAALRVSASRVSYEAGATIFRNGSLAHSVFFVERGAVRLMRFGRAGEEVVLHDARAGEFFAEASLDSVRYHCEAVASEPTELLQVPAAALRELLDADREFARQWLASLARQLRAVRTRVERLSLKGAAERVRHLLVSEGRGTQCEVVLPGTLKDLARNLGLTHEVLYRTLAAMERDRVIERQGATLRLVGSQSPYRATSSSPVNDSAPHPDAATSTSGRLPSIGSTRRAAGR